MYVCIYRVWFSWLVLKFAHFSYHWRRSWDTCHNRFKIVENVAKRKQPFKVDMISGPLRTQALVNIFPVRKKWEKLFSYLEKIFTVRIRYYFRLKHKDNF